MKLHTAFKISESTDIDYAPARQGADPVRLVALEKFKKFYPDVDIDDAAVKVKKFPMPRKIGGDVVIVELHHDDGQYDYEKTVVWPNRTAYDESVARMKKSFPRWHDYKTETFGPYESDDKYGVTRGYVSFDTVGLPDRIQAHIELVAADHQ